MGTVYCKDVLCGRCVVYVVTVSVHCELESSVVALVLSSDEDGSESSGGEESKDNVVSRFCTAADYTLVEQMHNAYISV